VLYLLAGGRGLGLGAGKTRSVGKCPKMPQNPASQVQAVLGASADWSKTPCPTDAFLSAGKEPTNKTLPDIIANLQARFNCLQPPALQTDITNPRRLLRHATAGKPPRPTSKPAACQARDYDRNTPLLTYTFASPLH